MSLIQNDVGIQPELKKYILQIDKALSAAGVLVVTPDTLGSSAAAVNTAIGGAAAKFTRDVVIEFQDADGTVHDWLDGTFAIAVAEVTAGNGVSAIAGSATVATFINGRATITIEYTGTWAAADTQTFTITGSTRLGYTVANKTSVDTLIA